MSVLFAATYPERTLALVLANPEPRFTATTDLPWAPTREEWDRRTEEEVRSWGTRQHAFAIAQRSGLLQDEETLAALARRMRLAASPGAVRSLREMNAEIDVRSVLPSVQAPTLVLSYTDRAEVAQYVADRIPDAERAESRWAEVTEVLDTLTAFLARAQEDWERQASQPERVLATVLFTDLVDIAGQAADGEVVVSGTVRDLVAGSGIEFEPRGTRALKGLGEWPLFAVTWRAQ